MITASGRWGFQVKIVTKAHTSMLVIRGVSQFVDRVDRFGDLIDKASTKRLTRKTTSHLSNHTQTDSEL